MEVYYKSSANVNDFPALRFICLWKMFTSRESIDTNPTKTVSNYKTIVLYDEQLIKGTGSLTNFILQKEYCKNTSFVQRRYTYTD